MTSTSPAAPITVRSTRTPTLACVSASPVRQLHRRHDQQRTITLPFLDRLRPLTSIDAIRLAPLTEHHHDAAGLPPSDDAALDDNPGNARTIPVAIASTRDHKPENLSTHRHPAVPSTSAPVPPAARRPGPSPC